MSAPSGTGRVVLMIRGHDLPAWFNRPLTNADHRATRRYYFEAQDGTQLIFVYDFDLAEGLLYRSPEWEPVAVKNGAAETVLSYGESLWLALCWNEAWQARMMRRREAHGE